MVVLEFHDWKGIVRIKEFDQFRIISTKKIEAKRLILILPRVAISISAKASSLVLERTICYFNYYLPHHNKYNSHRERKNVRTVFDKYIQRIKLVQAIVFIRVVNYTSIYLLYIRLTVEFICFRFLHFTDSFHRSNDTLERYHPSPLLICLKLLRHQPQQQRRYLYCIVLYIVPYYFLVACFLFYFVLFILSGKGLPVHNVNQTHTFFNFGDKQEISIARLHIKWCPNFKNTTKEKM